MTVPITGSVKDVTGVEDNDTPWSFASVIRFAEDGSVITEKPREVRAVSGNLKVNLVPGYAIVTYGKQVWQVTVPETATTLKALIEAGVAFPPDTDQERLIAAVTPIAESVGTAAAEAAAPAAVGQAAADMNPVPVPGPTPGKIAISFNGTTGEEFNPLPASWAELPDKPAVIGAGHTADEARGVLNTPPRLDGTSDTPAPLPFIAGGDYGALGSVDDTAAIQDALDSGHPIFLPAGVFTVTTLTLDGNAWLRGVGIGKTIIRQKAGTTGPVIRTVNNHTGLLDLGDFTIDGNKENQSSANIGLDVDNTGTPTEHRDASVFGNIGHDPHHTVSNIYIVRTKGDGMRVQGRGGNTFSCIKTMETDGHGFNINGWDSSYSQLDSGAAGKCAFYFGPGCASNRFTNLKGWYSGQIDRDVYGQGFFFDGASHNQLSTLCVQNSGSTGVFMKTARYNAITGLEVEFPPNPANPADGLYLEDCDSVTVIGLTIVDRTSPAPYSLRNGIVLAKGAGAGTTNCILIGTVRFTSAALATYAGSGQTFSGNLLLLNGIYMWAPRLDMGYLRTFTDDTAAGVNSVPNGEVYVTPLGTLRRKQAATPVVTKAANYTALDTDETILVDASSGSVTVALPSAVYRAGKVYNVKKIDASANSVTIDPYGAETVDGAATKSTTTQWANMRVQSNGTAWFVL